MSGILPLAHLILDMVYEMNHRDYMEELNREYLDIFENSPDGLTIMRITKNGCHRETVANYRKFKYFQNNIGFYKRPKIFRFKPLKNDIKSYYLPKNYVYSSGGFDYGGLNGKRVIRCGCNKLLHNCCSCCIYCHPDLLLNVNKKKCSCGKSMKDCSDGCYRRITKKHKNENCSCGKNVKNCCKGCLVYINSYNLYI